VRWIFVGELFVEMIDPGEKTLLGVGMECPIFVSGHGNRRDSSG
jgi:hypothetical protein